MEYEVVSIRVPKGFVRDGFHLVVDQILEGDRLVEYCHLKDASPGRKSGLPLRLLLRPDNAAAGQMLRPDWNPPKMEKGWITWDDGGWRWWGELPVFGGDILGWVNSMTGGYDGGEDIGGRYAKCMRFPQCGAFDQEYCIWEVGE